ncbi:MAG: aldo/keto reductase [Spirochaetes bacterium]|nr:aldo/keto reductase [Spirochaetota bacterium]
MKYRKFGKLDWEVSAVGFGIMNLLKTGPDIDDIKSAEIIRNAIDKGVNIIDAGCWLSAPDYQKAAETIRNALKEGRCDKVRISAGVQVSDLFSANDFFQCLNEDLERLNTDKIDFYYLRGLDRTTWPIAQEMKLPECLDTALSDGRIGNAGFYFHDHFRFLKNVVESYDRWSFCRFRYSFMDADHHPGTAGVKYAADKGLAVITEEPLLSGRLVRNVPESAAKILDESNTDHKSSPAGSGLLWILNQSEVSTVIINTNSPEEIDEYFSMTENAEPGCLSVQELLVVNRIIDAYKELKAVPCTTCRACMPCPVNIDVPRIFELYNEAAMYGNIEIPASAYRLEGHSIEACSSCGKCLKTCGRKIPIPEKLKEANDLFTGRDCIKSA